MKKSCLEELQGLFSQALEILNKAVEEQKKEEKKVKVWDLREMHLVSMSLEDAKKHLEAGGAILDTEGNSLVSSELEEASKYNLILVPRTVGG